LESLIEQGTDKNNASSFVIPWTGKSRCSFRVGI